MKVLTLSHVDADWIKQRPHFIAEALQAQGREVVFAYARAYQRDNLVASSMNCRTVPLILVPNRMRGVWFLRLIDAFLQWFTAAILVLRFRPDVVWLCSPRLEGAARCVTRLSGAKLVYDYMDRNGAFDGAHPRVIEVEHRLFEQADLVVCSSETLLNDVAMRVPRQSSQLVRNAMADPDRWLSRHPTGERMTSGLVLGYAGTISSWFDFDLLVGALDENREWSVRLWGPVDVVRPAHERIKFEGVLGHDALPAALHECDVLIMPFCMTPLIEAVDPVKAYEYVATGRGVVLPRYDETRHFEPFAVRYEPGEVRSFVTAVREAASRQVPQDVSDFVEENDWSSRVCSLRFPWDEQ